LVLLHRLATFVSSHDGLKRSFYIFIKIKAFFLLSKVILYVALALESVWGESLGRSRERLLGVD